MLHLTVFRIPARFPSLRKASLLLSTLLLATIALWLLFHALSPADAQPAPTSLEQPVAAQAQPASLASTDGPDFSTRRFFGPPNDATRSVAVGDMNGDGALDIVVGNYGQQNAVYLNDGHGHFYSSGTYTRPFGTGVDATTSVAAGDVNGDGALDIVVGNYSGQNVVYLNNGGYFTETRLVGAGVYSTTSVAVGDMNGDGALDIVVGNESQQNAVYLNDGLGRFTSVYTRAFGTGLDHTLSVAVGDTNGDGALDIVVGNDGGQNAVYLNDGMGNFSNVYTRPFGAGSDHSVAVGDMNGDGALDIIVGTYDQQNMVYLNDGWGNFYTGTVDCDTPPATVACFQQNKTIWWYWTRSVAVGDMNGDGALDIVVGNDGRPNAVYLNDGGGHFYTETVNCTAPPENAVCFGTGSDDTYSLAVGDMNGDGALDLVVGNDSQQNMVYLNNGAGDSVYAKGFAGGSGNTYSVAVGDMNGDGALDILVGNYYEQNVVYLNDGMGIFSNVYTRPFGAGTDDTRSVAVGDMNGDGALDIVAGNYGQQSKVYLNDGMGNFSTRPLGTGPYSTTSVAVGDMNGDGALDIVVGNNGQQNIVYLNNGIGNFISTRSFGTGPYSTKSIAVGDMNGDGASDIVVGNEGQQNMVYLNDGTGNFTARPFGTGSDETRGVAVGDLNGDGALDTVVGSYQQQNMVYLNDGTGNFPGTDAYIRYFGTGGDATQSVAVGDMNGDGALDIVVGNGWEQNVVYLNNSAGDFVPRPFETLMPSTPSVAVGDLNGDGALDIVAGYYYWGGAMNAVYLNNLGRSGRLANNPPRVAITRPNPLVNANFVYTNPALRTSTIPLTYTLFDREGEPVRVIRASYSPDGGGRWYTATAASPQGAFGSGTVTSSLFTLGSALSFDGVDDYMDVPDSANLDIADELTLQAWVKLTNPASDQKIVGKTPLGSGYMLGESGGMLYPEIWDSTGTRYWFKAGSIPPNQWTHLAVTWKKAGQMIGYVNGIPVSTTTASTNPIGLNNTALRIGRAPSGWADPFAVTGQIDEVRVYARALSADEIRNTMMRTLTSTTPGLAGYWRFNEGRGNTAFDQTPNHNNGTLYGPPTWTDVAFPYVYNWDVFASGFFGQSDNVAFRLEACPVLSPTVNGTPNPYQRPYLSAQTLPFRVRGTQVRVLSNTAPVSNAVVYRLPAGQSTGAEPIADAIGQPFHTDGQGYLQGRGQIYPGDRLVALLPISSTGTYTLYCTSAAPTPTGLTPYTVTTSGVQVLAVTAANPLILFNLEVSLEWDARQDTAYLNQLEFNLKRASEVLYDITNGQAALGDITLYHNGEQWNNAHLRIYTNNQLRPFADQGGIVITPTTDPLTSTVIYFPGQVNMGATWNRYGDAGITLGEDWPRTLAHELGHYLLYLDDDYLGLDANGLLTPTSTCTGTIMTDAYRDDYSELRPPANWLPACANTLSNKTTGRSDWATVDALYPALNITSNTGPSGLPLAVTQIRTVNPVTPTTALPDPRFYLTHNGARVQPGGHAQAYLFRSNWLLNLGRPVVDQVLARGAQPNDRVCVYELEANRLGCKTISANDNQQLALDTVSDWQPDVRISPVNSQTVNVRVLNLPTVTVPSLQARLYDDTGFASPTLTLTYTGSVYSGTFNLSEPVLEASLHLWVNEADPRREIVTDYSLGGNPGNKRSHFGNKRSHFGNKRSHFAPVLSGDGQVILYSANLSFPTGEFYTFQTASLIPNPPPWATVVGNGYWLSRSAGAPALVGPSISMGYAQNEVPTGEESFLRVYVITGTTWVALPTTLDPDNNLAVAPAQGPGLYALMSTIEISLHGPGWDSFAYPVQGTRSVTQALQSISGTFATVYWYDWNNVADPWKVYNMSVPTWVNDLDVLRFGETYLISLTQAITLQLKGASALASVNSASNLVPPATYYGAVLASDELTPTAGMTVTAWINGIQCGQGRTLDVNGQIKYTINVLADGPGAAGCGAPGRKVAFKIGTLAVSPTVLWDNNRLWQVSLTTKYRVYLPLIVK